MGNQFHELHLEFAWAMEELKAIRLRMERKRANGDPLTMAEMRTALAQVESSMDNLARLMSMLKPLTVKRLKR